MQRKQFEFEIVEHLGTLTADTMQTVTKELNKVSWCGNKAVYEIRSWKNTDNGKHPLKGITFTDNELKVLCEVLRKLDLC